MNLFDLLRQVVERGRAAPGSALHEKGARISICFYANDANGGPFAGKGRLQPVLAIKCQEEPGFDPV